ISDRGTHFCNDQFTRVMIKYGATHRLATVYHPQTSGQVEVSNHGLKRILERTVGENRTSWSDKLDDALWALRTAYKTLIGCTPYKLVYGKSCHLPIELEHRAYWALKHVNFDLKTTGNHRKLQLNELSELRDQAYKNSVIYKERTKKLHDSKIKNRIFNVGDQVLLFNSRLKIFSGKLKTRWSGPFTITQVYPYDTIELSQPNGPNFKVNGHRVKHYFGVTMTSLADKAILSGADNHPPMVEKDIPLLWPTIEEDGVTRLKKYSELSTAEAIQADCNERECKLYDAFDKFAYQKGEPLCDFYLIFSLLLNDMNMYNMKLEQFQVNIKFLNTLPSEWSKFVTDVKLVRDLHTTNVDQLHAYLSQHEYHANEVRLMHERTSDPLALVSQHQMNRLTYQHHQQSYHQPQFQQQASTYQSSLYATSYHTLQ
nr:reverse transcriptase domain-containing protein [Tanacetum cinerariifolium]